MSQEIDPIDIEARLRVRYPEMNWTVGEARAGTWLHITGNMPSRSLTEVINLGSNRYDRRYDRDDPIQAGDRVATALLNRAGLNAEVRVAERILRRFFENVTVGHNADGTMVIEISDTNSGEERGYYRISSVDELGDFVANVLAARNNRNNAALRVLYQNINSPLWSVHPSPSPQPSPSPPAQEYRCVTSVMLDRSVTL